MRAINLISLVQAHQHLDATGYEKYVARHAIIIRPKEIDDARSLIGQLRENGLSGSVFDKYYVGYRIPQIGKEFDLLRFGDNYNVNLELKSDFDPVKMQRQLCRNKYYLGYLEKRCHFLAYSSSAKRFVTLAADDSLVDMTTDEVRNLLLSQTAEDKQPIDDRFNPSNYLVSPLNSPGKFLIDQYFLTAQQEDVKHQILTLLNGNQSSAFVSLTGAAGTGKTLLAYDIIRTLAQAGRAPLIIHCGKLNNGHQTLINAGWKIISIRDMARIELSTFDTILLDEAQRVRPTQFADIVEKISSNRGHCIFSYDRSQTLADYETKNDIGTLIAAIPGVSKHSLSEKIRTNKEIANFIKSFVNSSRSLKIKDTGNIELIYFSSSEDAIQHLSSLDSSDWKVIKFTPSQYQREHHETYSAEVSTTSHDVIGQEFNGVAVMVDKFFTYNNEGTLIYTGRAYYQPAKMLFQNMTRARIKLQVIIINNPQMLDACMNIFQ